MKRLITYSSAILLACCTFMLGCMVQGEENLRGFGRVKVNSKAYEKNSISVMSFDCETEKNAETVAGKFLYDLYAEDGVTFKEGIHETKGGVAFAVARDENKTIIYAAEGRDRLASFLANEGKGKSLVEKAAVPEWMKAFRWGVYGVGGLENYHGWMEKAKTNAGIDSKADKSRLDPREDFLFLRDMGNIHFDNWLQEESFDNSDGILSPYIYPRKKIAEDYGIPFGVRLYMPTGGTGSFGWFARRFAAHMDRPAPWMQNGWLRYQAHATHPSWYDEDIWSYTAEHTKKAMQSFDTEGKARTWMHPAGELVHQPWYDWHADYSATASNSWHKYLREKGVALKETAAMFNRSERPFAAWDEVPVPEFAHFAGLSGMVLDLYGTWLTKTVDEEENSAWQELPDFPGNWDFLSLYGGANAAIKAHETAERRFRRVFSLTGLTRLTGLPPTGNHVNPVNPVENCKRIYLYFFPMRKSNSKDLRHEVSLNGGKSATVGAWCALDVTDQLREGENTLDILLRGTHWNGRVFLSTEKPQVYPNMAEARCRLWTLWHDWRRDVKAERCEMVFDAMRQADPNAPIEFMAPLRFGQRITNRLMRDWGAFAQFTGEGVWYFPWYKRYGKLYGYQGTSELAGPYDSVAKARTSSLRVFLAGLDMHKPVFLAQTYSRNPEVRQWWLKHKDLFARMGTYDIDMKQPQVLLYRRTELTEDSFPEPFPVIDTEIDKIRSPWNYDIGRGELQSIGQSYLYIDDDGIEDGKMDGFKVMFDCGNEIIPEDEVERIAKWVEKGGVFVAYPFTGRNTPLKADAWPMAKLTGSRIKANETIVRPGKVPKVTFPVGSRFFPSFAGQTIHGAKRRIYQLDFALETVADDAKPILFWEDGRIAATARRVGKGLVVHLGSMFWRGSEDVKGMWNPSDEVERTFLRDLLAAVGHSPALVETDDRLVLAQPYRSHDGLNFVAVLCNFNEEGEELAAKNAKNAKKETVVRLRCGRKPRRIVGYAGEGILFSNHKCHNCSQITNANSTRSTCSTRLKDNPVELPFDWDEAEGVATVKVTLPPQEVAVLNAECYAPGDALAHWWKNSAEQWHELKKPTRDFSKYTQGKWQDPTQDLKEGWNVSNPVNPVNPVKDIPLDCLQFWGWPEGKGAVCRKIFDLEDGGWLKDGSTVRLITGAWVGPNFLTPATIRLNGTTLVEKSVKTYLDFDVTSVLKERGNTLEIEFIDAPEGDKFTGMNGSIYLYRREKPIASVDLFSTGLTGLTGLETNLVHHVNPVLTTLGGKDSVSIFVPAEWQGKYRVRLYMEGAKNVPKGVRVRDRFMRKHHHNFGSITDIDITDLLRFGEVNRIDIGANSAAEQPDKTSIEPLSVLRLDLYKDEK